jgi:hypothetical protein
VCVCVCLCVCVSVCVSVCLCNHIRDHVGVATVPTLALVGSAIVLTMVFIAHTFVESTHRARTVLCAATHGFPAATRMSQGPSAAAATTSARSEAIIIVPFELTNHLVCVDGCGPANGCNACGVQCSMDMSGCGQPYASAKKWGGEWEKKGNRVTSK